jgi:DNA polymerase-3 subunit epsilon
VTGPWIDGPMLAFDTETTGVQFDSDRILSASMINLRAGETGDKIYATTEWINPGVPIPPEATTIHGITDEFIKLNGGNAPDTLEAVTLILRAMLDDGIPIVGMNVTFDLTMLDRNCRRFGITPLSERIEVAPVIDCLILDKRADRFRKGKGGRKLSALCPLYRVENAQAHDSEADAMAAARVAWRIGRLYPQLGELTAMQLHRLQGIWKVEQDKGLAAYLKREGRDATGLDGSWPVALPNGKQELEDVPLW